MLLQMPTLATLSHLCQVQNILYLLKVLKTPSVIVSKVKSMTKVLHAFVLEIFNLLFVSRDMLS